MSDCADVVQKIKALIRGKYKCFYCGTTEKLTIDHIIPRGRGGKHGVKNLYIACIYCHNKRHDHWVELITIPESTIALAKLVEKEREKTPHEHTKEIVERLFSSGVA